jgi:hypothetical protein
MKPTRQQIEAFKSIYDRPLSYAPMFKNGPVAPTYLQAVCHRTANHTPCIRLLYGRVVRDVARHRNRWIHSQLITEKS